MKKVVTSLIRFVITHQHYYNISKSLSFQGSSPSSGLQLIGQYIRLILQRLGLVMRTL